LRNNNKAIITPGFDSDAPKRSPKPGHRRLGQERHKEVQPAVPQDD